MKRAVTYTDARGGSHLSAEGATVSDIAQLFVGEKMPIGAATAMAKCVYDKRKELERIFAEHDEAIQPS